jgi:peptidoglycan/xylan/chitin deacetylase (PgdA/CDA1 family)
MDWPTLLALEEQGIELGSHTASHRPLVSLSAAELARDLCRSRIALHERLGGEVRSLCYPYGLHDPAVVALAGACGFHFGVTTNEWHASFGDEMLALPRIEVRGADTLTEFVAKLRG